MGVPARYCLMGIEPQTLELRRRLAAAEALLREHAARDAAFREHVTRHRLLIESWAQAVWETDAAGVVVADSPAGAPIPAKPLRNGSATAGLTQFIQTTAPMPSGNGERRSLRANPSTPSFVFVRLPAAGVGPMSAPPPW